MDSPVQHLLDHIAEGTSKSNLSRARLILKEKVELTQQQKNAGLF